MNIVLRKIWTNTLIFAGSGVSFADNKLFFFFLFQIFSAKPDFSEYFLRTRFAGSTIFLTSPSETARQQLTTIVLLLLLLLLLLRTSNGLVHTNIALLSLVDTHWVQYKPMYQAATDEAVCFTVHMCRWSFHVFQMIKTGGIVKLNSTISD